MDDHLRISILESKTVNCNLTSVRLNNQMQKTRKTQRKIILNRRIHVSFTIHFKQTLASKLLKFTVQQDSASPFYFSRDYQFRSLFNYRSSTPKLLVISIFHFFSLFSFSLLFFFFFLQVLSFSKL